MATRSSPAADIGLALVLIAVALLTIYGTLELPPGSFEPLGSARIPQIVSGGIIVLSLWVLGRAVARRRRAADAGDGGVAPAGYRSRHDLAIALMLLAVVYVAVMAMDWVRFSIATLVFLAAAVGMLCGFQRRALPVIGVLAVVFGFGLEYLFTQVFVIDLP